MVGIGPTFHYLTMLHLHDHRHIANPAGYTSLTQSRQDVSLGVTSPTKYYR